MAATSVPSDPWLNSGDLLGGESFGPSGLVLPPQVLVSSNRVAAAREEVFGPAISIIRATDEEDALRLANETEYGLSSAVRTSDLERGVQFSLRLDAGMTHVNDSPVNEEDHVAYGGEKQSGLGRFGRVHNSSLGVRPAHTTALPARLTFGDDQETIWLRISARIAVIRAEGEARLSA
jgi:acyl-CoA reductase-like NAD-dependent aldehyde dehydrogenase